MLDNAKPQWFGLPCHVFGSRILAIGSANCNRKIVHRCFEPESGANSKKSSKGRRIITGTGLESHSLECRNSASRSDQAILATLLSLPEASVLGELSLARFAFAEVPFAASATTITRETTTASGTAAAAAITAPLFHLVAGGRFANP